MKEHLLGSYLVRFSKSAQLDLMISLQDLRTGQQLEFDSWVSAWAFLDDRLTEVQAPAGKADP